MGQGENVPVTRYSHTGQGEDHMCIGDAKGGTAVPVLSLRRLKVFFIWTGIICNGSCAIEMGQNQTNNSMRPQNQRRIILKH
jgi:hypothetical protein